MDVTALSLLRSAAPPDGLLRTQVCKRMNSSAVGPAEAPCLLFQGMINPPVASLANAPSCIFLCRQALITYMPNTLQVSRLCFSNLDLVSHFRYASLNLILKLGRSKPVSVFPSFATARWDLHDRMTPTPIAKTMPIYSTGAQVALLKAVSQVTVELPFYSFWPVNLVF